jgi:hypothetical protein
VYFFVSFSESINPISASSALSAVNFSSLWNRVWPLASYTQLRGKPLSIRMGDEVPNGKEQEYELHNLQPAD